MHMALTSDEWLILNARYCNRYHARMTSEGCSENRQKADDLRCAGCNGLEDMQRELEYREPAVIQCEPGADDPMTQALAGALQEILDGEYDEESLEDLEAGGLDDEPEEELTSFHHKLLALLDCDLEEPEERKATPEKTRNRRVAVFMGRCPHCKGYMLNTIELHGGIKDNDVYRCYNCGWRTSPEYEQNRKLAASAN